MELPSLLHLIHDWKSGPAGEGVRVQFTCACLQASFLPTNTLCPDKVARALAAERARQWPRLPGCVCAPNDDQHCGPSWVHCEGRRLVVERAEEAMRAAGVTGAPSSPRSTP